MAKDDQTQVQHSFNSAETDQKFHPPESSIMMPLPPSIPRKNRGSSKCFVYCLLLFVLLFAVVLIFSLIVLRSRPPKFKLHSAKITSLNYDLSPSLSLQTQAQFRIKNRDYGELSFDRNSTRLSLNFGDLIIGEVKLDKAVGTVRARSEKDVKVVMKGEMSNDGALKDDYRRQDELRNQLRSGFLELGIFGNWKGEAKLMGKVERGGAGGEVNCFVRIDLRQKVVRMALC